MFALVISVLIVITVIVLVFKSRQPFNANIDLPPKETITVKGPRPDTANPYRFYKFVALKPVCILEPWYKEMLRQNYVFKPGYEQAVKQKIATREFTNPIDFEEYFGRKFDYIAIDFETANNQRISACAIGLAFVKDGSLVDEDWHYIHPPAGTRFLKRNIGIHGITKEDVEYSRKFNELWERDLKKYLCGNLVVLHNASMDASILRQLFEYYDIKDYCVEYVCTMSLAKSLGYPGQLSVLCSTLGIDYDQEHDPEEDASACAMVADRFISKGINLREYSKFISDKN